MEDHPGSLAIGLFPYGPCMEQLVRGLDIAAGPASGECPEDVLRQDARCELLAAQNAYPFALGAVELPRQLRSLLR